MRTLQASTSGRSHPDYLRPHQPACWRNTPPLRQRKAPCVRQENLTYSSSNLKGLRAATEGQDSSSLEATIQEGLDEQERRGTETKQRAREYKQLNDQIEATASELRERLQGTSIYLVGMMGSGKSTVGKLLGRALQYPFLDSDQIAESHAGSTISQIFAEEGEEAFRDLESAVLQELMPFRSCVVATGGGAVTRRQNWGYMQHGVVVWLSGPPELLARRACEEGSSTRPLLGDSDDPDASKSERIAATQSKLTAILDKRRDQYSQADLTISLQDQNGSELGAPVSVVAYRLLRALNERIRKDRKQEPGGPPPDYKGFGKP